MAEKTQERRRSDKETGAKKLIEVQNALKAGLTGNQIETALAKEWNVDPRTVRGYITRVRRVTQALVTQDERLEAAWLIREYLREIIGEARSKKDSKGKPAPDHGIMLKAIDRVCRVHGLYVDRLEHSGPGGAPIPVAQGFDLKDLSDDELAETRRVAQRLSALQPLGLTGVTGR